MSAELIDLSDFCPIPLAEGHRRSADKVLVFIHGIFSKHVTFEALAEKLRSTGLGNEYQFAYFDYNFHQSIPLSGAQLAGKLKDAFGGTQVEVTLVGHSMGGLVGRFALLQFGHEMPFIKRLIMLGTPNHGTLHTGRLGPCAGLIREVTGTLWALIPNTTGVKELTEIDKLLDQHLTATTEARTHHVEYVSIPATCFHEGAGWIHLMGASQSRGIGSVPLMMELFLAHPSTKVSLQIPHDGIVEESSVTLSTRGGSTRRSERMQTCQMRPNCGPYLHVRHDEYRRESHITIQSADRTAEIIASLVLAPSLAAWQSAHSTFGYSFEPEASHSKSAGNGPFCAFFHGLCKNQP